MNFLICAIIRNSVPILNQWTKSILVQDWRVVSYFNKAGISVLVPFVTTYLAESGFSVLITMKTNARNKLNVEHDMRVALSMASPRIELLVAIKQQQQPSH